MIFATVLGNATRDAEVKTAGSNQVVKFSLASNKKTKDGDSTTFVNCSWFGARAVKMSQYITKGGKFLVTGEMSQREYNGKQYLELDVTGFEFTGNGGGGKRSGGQDSAPPANNGQYPESEYGEKATGQADDDLPF